MRILVIGAGRSGAKVIQQLQKNPDLTIMTVDPAEFPYAVEKGIIPKVDIRETVTPLTFDYVIEQANPDLVLLTRTSEDLGLGKAPGLDMLAEALREELAEAGNVPVIEVSRSRS